MNDPSVFKIDDFLIRFPEFADESAYSRSTIQNAGQRAMMHVTPDVDGMPMGGPYRDYALFLMTAHIITLDATTDSDDTSLSGTPFKATIGSVTVETSKQNSFNSDDWNYWLNQTKYGRELLAYLDTQATGIFANNDCDSVRDLF